MVMKNILFISLAVATLLFTSCEKCYKCELTVNGQTEVESFCGNPEEANTYEAAGYTCSAN
jgi:hypothetical protein